MILFSVVQYRSSPDTHTISETLLNVPSRRRKTRGSSVNIVTIGGDSSLTCNDTENVKQHHQTNEICSDAIDGAIETISNHVNYTSDENKITEQCTSIADVMEPQDEDSESIFNTNNHDKNMSDVTEPQCNSILTVDDTEHEDSVSISDSNDSLNKLETENTSIVDAIEPPVFMSVTEEDLSSSDNHRTCEYVINMNEVEGSVIVNFDESKYQDCITNEEINGIDDGEIVKNGGIGNILSSTVNFDFEKSDSTIGPSFSRHKQLCSQLTNEQLISISSADIETSQSSALLKKQRMQQAQILLQTRVNNLQQCPESVQSFSTDKATPTTGNNGKSLENIPSKVLQRYDLSFEAVTNIYSGIDIGSVDNLQTTGSEGDSNLYNGIEDPYDSLQLPGYDVDQASHMSISNCDDTSDGLASHHNGEVKSSVNKDDTEHFLKVSGSVIPSKHSAFQQIRKSPTHVDCISSGYASISKDNLVKDHVGKCKIERNYSSNTVKTVQNSLLHEGETNKLNKIINVIVGHAGNYTKSNKEEEFNTSGTSSSEEECKNQDSSPGKQSPTSKKEAKFVSSTSSIEEEYRNQETVYNKPSPETSNTVYKRVTPDVSQEVTGAQQLVNILDSNEIKSDEYYVPGIHNSSDSPANKLKSTPKKLIEASIPKFPSSVANNNFSSASPRSVSSSSKSLEKTIFRRNTRSSTTDSTDRIKDRMSFDAGHFYSDSESDTCSTSDQSWSILADLGITDDFIGLKEDHFSTPDVRNFFFFFFF